MCMTIINVKLYFYFINVLQLLNQKKGNGHGKLDETKKSQSSLAPKVSYIIATTSIIYFIVLYDS